MQPLYAFRVRRDKSASRVPHVQSHPSPPSLLRTNTHPTHYAKMSSPSHRRQRSSQSGTPKRSSRKSSQAPPSSPPMDPSAAQLLGEAASSQPGSRGTPRNSRKAQLSSSPVFYRSSPANGAASARNMEISSPLRQVTNDHALTDDGDRTPRATGQLIGGM